MTNPGAWTARVAAALAVAVVIAVLPAACGEDVADPSAEIARLDFVLKDMSGKDVKLADFKGRPLVVNFWATWCPPCKEEIPAFVELVDKYKEQQLTVLGISVSDSAAELQAFAPTYHINYPLLVGDGHDDLLDTFEAGISVPVTWFIRRDGTVLMKKMGPGTKEWFETQVKALF